MNVLNLCHIARGRLAEGRKTRGFMQILTEIMQVRVVFNNEAHDHDDRGGTWA